MKENLSCSSCCGIHNLAMNDIEKNSYLKDVTQRFLNTDISLAANIVEFRKIGEENIHHFKIKQDVYVCPFLGFVSDAKTGCLLHPLGSPHPDIHKWEHPQNFSFYGEGICQAFDCLAKDNVLNHDLDNANNGLDYSRLAAHYNLLRALNGLSKMVSLDMKAVRADVMQILAWENVPVTGFEEAVKPVESKEGLIKQIAEMLCREWFTGDKIPEEKLSKMIGKVNLYVTKGRFEQNQKKLS